MFKTQLSSRRQDLTRAGGWCPLVVLTACCLVATGCGSGAGGAATTVSGSTVTPPTTPAITVTLAGNNTTRIGAPEQVTAAVANSSNATVIWQVNNVTGGSATTGTISTAGLYTPPSVVPNPSTVTITAISQASATATGSLIVAILNPLPVITSAAASGTGPSYLLDVAGTGFVSGAVLQVAGSPVTTTFVSTTELQATVTPATGTTALSVAVTNPNPGTVSSAAVTATVTTVKTSLASAARLLDQATFGPTLNDIQHVQTIGLNAYLTEQFNTPATVLPNFTLPFPTTCVNSLLPCEQSEWWQEALTAPDQLRQRVAFALSEIFVVSTNSVDPRSVITFQNTLAKDAFTNFYTIMTDVTLSPAMGGYLNMVNSNKPGTVNGVVQIANENYARENMQLFTTGIDLLNPDGSLQLDSNGNAIPVYTEAQVQAFARAYTGWTYANASGTGTPTKFPNSPMYTAPMGAVESAHDTGAKILLNGTTLPAGQTAAADLAGALQNIFNHPNVGPFVCRQLIQHLVASSPSPAYVARVSAVFADNGVAGGHKRGDMQAVITAILNDADARAGDTSANFDGGHLREAMLYMTNVLRGLGFTNNDAVAGNDVIANASYSTLSGYTNSLGEKPYSSGSVFNFFPPDYVVPGTTFNAPEFGQENTASAVLRLTLAEWMVWNKITGFTVDLSKTSALGITASKTGNATTDSGNLVDSLGVIFLHGQMPANMRTAIVNHVATLTDPAQRVRVATYLIITSSQYKIEH